MQLSQSSSCLLLARASLSTSLLLLQLGCTRIFWSVGKTSQTPEQQGQQGFGTLKVRFLSPSALQVARFVRPPTTVHVMPNSDIPLIYSIPKRIFLIIKILTSPKPSPPKKNKRPPPPPPPSTRSKPLSKLDLQDKTFEPRHQLSFDRHC